MRMKNRKQTENNNKMVGINLKIVQIILNIHDLNILMKRQSNYKVGKGLSKEDI